MKVEILNKNLSQIKAEMELVFVVNKKMKHRFVRDAKTLQTLGFKGEADQLALLPEKKRLYIGLSSLSTDDLRSGAGLATKALSSSKIKSLKLGLYFNEEGEKAAQALTEGFIIGAYTHQKYKSKTQKSSLKKVILTTEAYEKKEFDFSELKKAVASGLKISQATNFTRDIVNQTPEEMTPQEMAKTAKELAKKVGLQVKVYGDAYLKKEGMNAMLGVSQASPHPAQLIHLIHKAEGAKMRVAIVGKGLTYDTGGLSLKPSQHMRTMKQDKAGGSAVLGIMKAVAELNLPIEVHGIVGAVENAIGKNAYKPDDVLTAKNGKTIEVQNTDAEGRLVLADCLCYAQDLKPDYIIDLATLTGACVVALGEYSVGVMGNSRKLKEKLRDSAFAAGELTGNLPFNKHLAKLIKSEVADISNISSGPYGGAITAAMFLNEFIEKKNKDKWIHLDIAGPAFTEKPWGIYGYGATGAGVRMVIEWIRALTTK